MEFDDFFTLSQGNLTHSGPSRLLPEIVSADARFHFFSVRVERVWRTLPIHLTAAGSLELFLSRLNIFDCRYLLRGRALVIV